MSSGETRALRAAAGASVALHAAGLVLAVMFLRPGTPAVALLERVSYLSSRPPGWIAGWIVWMACALALAAFLVLLARERPTPLLRAAALVALIGAALDIACDSAYLGALPGHARGDVAAFATFERRLTMLSQTGANGLYTLAVLLATIGLDRIGADRIGLDRARVLARVLGAATVAGGLLLALAGLTGSPLQVAAGTAIAIPAFMAWTLAVAARTP